MKKLCTDLEVRKSILPKSFLLHISKIAFEPSNSLIANSIKYPIQNCIGKSVWMKK